MFFFPLSQKHHPSIHSRNISALYIYMTTFITVNFSIFDGNIALKHESTLFNIELIFHRLTSYRKIYVSLKICIFSSCGVIFYICINVFTNCVNVRRKSCFVNISFCVCKNLFDSFLFFFIFVSRDYLISYRIPIKFNDN